MQPFIPLCVLSFQFFLFSSRRGNQGLLTFDLNVGVCFGEGGALPLPEVTSPEFGRFSDESFLLIALAKAPVKD